MIKISVINLKEEVLYTYVPPNTLPKFKLTIERDDGTVDDLTADITSLTVEDYVTESIGSFEFVLVNPNNAYTGRYNGNEIIRYYKDYSTTATTLRFRGRTETISSKGFNIRIGGRSESLKFFGVTVTGSYNNFECSIILLALMSVYAPGFTYNNINTSTTYLTVNWYNKPFWDCVKELCLASGFDCYVDSTLDFHFHLIGSINNEDEAVVHNLNLLSINDFTPAISEVRNRIIVYGAEQEGIQIIYTAEDSASQTAYGLKEDIIKDDNITTYEQAVDVGEFELANKKDPPVFGSTTSLLMSTIQPGERVYISAPDDNLPTGLYLTSGYRDTIDWGDGDYITEIFISKEPRKLSHIMRDRVQQENQTKRTNFNPEGMLQSYTFLFAEDSGTHSNTSISNGYLIPLAIAGYWISPTRTLSSNIITAYLNMNGDQLDAVTVEVSGNGGISYQTITNKNMITISSAIGVALLIKVTFAATAARVDSLALLYNMS